MKPWATDQKLEKRKREGESDMPNGDSREKER